MSLPKRIVVLASGRGSNFEAIHQAIARKEIAAEIVAVITNRPNAEVIERAHAHQIPVEILASRPYVDKNQRPAFDAKLLETVKAHRPDFLVLAGFMWVLDESFVEAFPNQILNIHPSLLPAFKGLHAQRQALTAGVSETGCTVHFVTVELDSGPIISQRRLAIERDDTETTLADRLRPLEHECYVEALKWVCSKKFQIQKNRVVFL